MTNETRPIEESLFKANGGWDGDQCCMTFYDCVVTTPFGPYKIGDKLDHVHLVYDCSIIQVYRETMLDEEFIPEWVGSISLHVENA